MNQTTAVWLVLALALVGANLPFISSRWLLVGPRRPTRGAGWRLLELLICGALVVLAGFALEASLGQRAPQEWPFYVAMLCLFLTLAAPGFVWRYLRHGQGRPATPPSA